jgi:hypothetical protein
MDTTQYSGRSHTNGHSRESFVEQVHYATLGGTFLAYDRSLGSRIDKCLDWLFVDCNIDVEHCNLSEKLRELFLRSGIVLLDQTLLDLLLNLLLRLGIVWISVHQFGHPLLFISLFFKLLIQSLLDELLELPLVA